MNNRSKGLSLMVVGAVLFIVLASVAANAGPSSTSTASSTACQGIPAAGNVCSSSTTTQTQVPVTLTASSPSGAAGSVFTFSASSSVSAPVYTWTFGDGSIGTGSSISHIFASAGTFTVTVSMQSGTGYGSASTTITVTSQSTGSGTVLLVVTVVTSETNAVVPGASITVIGPTSLTGTTGVSGQASFQVTPGSYQISVSASGFNSNSVSETITSEGLAVTIDLSTSGGCVGSICPQSVAVIPGFGGLNSYQVGYGIAVALFLMGLIVYRRK